MNFRCNKQLQFSFATFAKILHAKKLTGTYDLFIYPDVFYYFLETITKKEKNDVF